MKKNSGFTLIELMIVVAIIAIIAAIAIPAILRARISGNETSAVGTLRTMVTQENLWHKQDPDGNGTNDYWAADVAGMYRTIRQPAATEAQMVDIAVARSDWAPDGNGDGNGGAAEFPLIAVAFAVGAQVPGLGAMAQVAPIPKSGYYTCAFVTDAAATAYAADMDGAGQLYENTSRFAFMAFPDTYDGTGMNAFIVEAAGVIWRIDAATGTFNLATGPVNDGTGAAAVPGNAAVPPIVAWPNANPANAGYAQAE